MRRRFWRGAGMISSIALHGWSRRPGSTRRRPLPLRSPGHCRGRPTRFSWTTPRRFPNFAPLFRTPPSHTLPETRVADRSRRGIRRGVVRYARPPGRRFRAFRGDPGRHADRRRYRNPGNRVAGAHRPYGEPRRRRDHRPADPVAQFGRRHRRSILSGWTAGRRAKSCARRSPRPLAPDPAVPQLLGWTRLGHFELVRPRRSRPLAEALLEPRSGGALVKTAVTVAHEALRALRRAARAQPGRRWRITVAPEVAAALAGAAADAVRQAEQQFARSIAIEADPGYDRERFQISAL